MMSVQQENTQIPQQFNRDYAGRYPTTEFEASGDELFNESKYDNKNHLEPSYDPFNITFIQHPTSGKKLAVITKPNIESCNICYMDHKTIYYTLEDNYCACYCKNYKNGNWVFKKN